MTGDRMVSAPDGWDYVRMGVDTGESGDFSAVALAATKETLQDLALAMLAGARAIELNRRFDGTTFVLDPFGKCGGPWELSYYEAVKLLRTQGDRLLEMLKEV